MQWPLKFVPKHCLSNAIFSLYITVLCLETLDNPLALCWRVILDSKNYPKCTETWQYIEPRMGIHGNMHTGQLAFFPQLAICLHITIDAPQVFCWSGHKQIPSSGETYRQSENKDHW